MSEQPSQDPSHRPAVTIVGSGPAGLIAAKILAEAGCGVTVFERMPSVGRKLLMAGRGGLNLTHSEPIEPFLGRYGEAASALRPFIEAFPPAAMRAFADGLGEATFVGSSGRVFPKSLKASPLLRAWLRRLDELGVRIETRREWLGQNEDGASRFRRPDGSIETDAADATLLALGGASWPRLGSTGDWAAILAARGIAVTPFRPSNVGFRVDWSDIFRERFAGTPLKTATFTFAGRTIRGEALISRYGIEGGAIYTLSSALRDAIEAEGSVRVTIDLCPQVAESEAARRIERQPPAQSLANRLRKALGLQPVAINLLRETAGPLLPREPADLAARLKSTPVTLVGTQGLERAISTAGGVAWPELDGHLMLTKWPGVFVAGEMIDWEAPTGGYLLQASLATGVTAAQGILARVRMGPG